MTDQGPRPAVATAGQAEPGADELMREQRLQRNLKLLVGFLGFLILAGLAAVVVRVMMLAVAAPDQAPTTTLLGQPAGDLNLQLPRGAKIVSIAASGDRLAVHYEGPSGVGIAVIDLKTGSRIIDVKPVEAAPRD